MIISSGRQEIVLGDSVPVRVGFRVLALGLVGLGLLFAMMSGRWSQFYSTLGLFYFVVWPFALLFAIYPAKVDSVIAVDDSENALIFTSRRARLLGAWPSLRTTTVLPLAVIDGRVTVQSQERWVSGQSGLFQSWLHLVVVPTELGNSTVLYAGNDRNVAEHIAVFVRSAVERTTAPRRPTQEVDGGINSRHRASMGLSPAIPISLAAALVLGVGMQTQAFGQDPVCPAGWIDYGQQQVTRGSVADRELGYPVGNYFLLCDDPSGPDTTRILVPTGPWLLGRPEMALE